MWIFKNRFFAILSAFLILMAVTTGIVYAQETDDSGNDASSDADDSSSSDSSVDDTSSDDSSSSEDSSSEESSSEDVSAEDDSNSADDGSTIVEVEETNSEETTVGVQDADDVIVSGGPVEYEEINTEVTEIGDGSTNIESGGSVIYKEESTAISHVDNSYNSEYSNNYTSTETTILENSTQEIDKSSDYTDNSTTTINTNETKTVNIDNSQNTKISFEDNSVVNNINFVSKESGKTKVIVKEVYERPPVENVYKTFNIFVDNAEVTSNMENAGVDFKVEKRWLIENNLDASVIVLNMYEGGKWIEVPVTVTGEDSQFVYFKAKVSKYSTFAISSKAVTVDKVIKQGNISEEEIDGPTKSVVIKMLEFVIELLEGN
ncbi:PGF-pre-PGF domain-containing protein [Methanosarcina hadiensis]|uniref:PGF-pre-PGF domain-containing protein n=1 Tax=Methanosarcina hadiensis TaxID=3078083 RepID=UPI0039779711